MGKLFQPSHQFPAGVDQYLPLRSRDGPTLLQLWHSCIGRVIFELALGSSSRAPYHQAHELHLVLPRG